MKEHEISYEIQKRNVKNYTIYVKNGGEVCVVMPVRGSEKHAAELVEEKSDWILKKQSEMEKKTVLSMEALKWKWEDEDRLRWMVEKIFPRFSRYEIPCPTLTFRKMKAHWGSCEKAHKRITLNKMLKCVPDACQEYVIVHELAHLVEANHSSAFYRVVEEILPDYRNREKMLRGYVIDK